MALKRQVATIEEVPEAFRGEYKPVEGGVGFALQVDGDEDTTTLKRTLERVKQERNDAIALAKAKGEDVANVEASWKSKLEEATNAHTESVKNTLKALKNVTHDRAASELATKLGVDGDAADLLKPVIEKRIKVELDGDRAITRILDAEGKASALTLADLETELRAEKRLSRLIGVSLASGSGAGPNRNTPPGGGTSTEEFNPVKNTNAAAHMAWVAQQKAKRGA